MRIKNELTLVLLAALLFPVLAVLTAAQTANVAGPVGATKENEELEKLKKDVIVNYDYSLYDEALRLSQQALDLAKKLQGEEGRDVALTYFNIGKILRMKKLPKEAIGNLERSLEIFQKKYPDEKKMILTVHNELAFAHYAEGRKAEAEKFFISALGMAETLYGIENAHILSYLNNLGGFYELQKKFDQAEPHLWRAVKLTNKLYEIGDPRAENAGDHYSCFLHTYYSTGGRKKIEKRNEDEDGATDKKFKSNSRVINGKATYLATPTLASLGRVPGEVMVRIRIGKSGEVISAKAYCGPQAMWGISEAAARNSKFKPTTLDGEPVVVSGLIVYSYH